MSDHIVVQTIIRECTENDGFLVKLHAYKIFDTERYSFLRDHLVRYRTMIGDQPEMSRAVAGCLLALQQEFDNQINLTAHRRTSDQEAAKLASAHEEVWQLIHDILRI